MPLRLSGLIGAPGPVAGQVPSGSGSSPAVPAAKSPGGGLAWLDRYKERRAQQEQQQLQEQQVQQERRQAQQQQQVCCTVNSPHYTSVTLMIVRQDDCSILWRFFWPQDAAAKARFAGRYAEVAFEGKPLVAPQPAQQPAAGAAAPQAATRSLPTSFVKAQDLPVAYGPGRVMLVMFAAMLVACHACHVCYA